MTDIAPGEVILSPDVDAMLVGPDGLAVALIFAVQALDAFAANAPGPTQERIASRTAFAGRVALMTHAPTLVQKLDEIVEKTDRERAEEDAG